MLRHFHAIVLESTRRIHAHAKLLQYIAVALQCHIVYGLKCMALLKNFNDIFLVPFTRPLHNKC